MFQTYIQSCRVPKDLANTIHTQNEEILDTCIKYGGTNYSLRV
jgi:hypothetical protein